MEGDGNAKGILRVSKEPAFNLYFNKNNLVVLIDDKQKLTLVEQQRLRELLAEEKAKYRQEAAVRFNSAKNRSIMMQDKHNDMRNEVMRRVYSRQLEKRRKGNFRNHAI